ncbi:MAG: N-acetylmuramoyl-L-alanine amidase [Rhodospirillaceae bacterium]|nr:N-acetylmuramoyl-L-alanine amidase [Rhodospirillaceae bacterium]|tara:strand:+ start:1305 stop:2009 length:705 start_codon:yes stop_codon:yes gene_type:complete
MKFVDNPSGNYDERVKGLKIDLLLLHYTGMKSCGEAINRLCDPLSKVSAHYLIDDDGTIFRLVPEEYRAWHAGVACWCEETDINSISIGIELVNPGHEFGYQPFPEKQMTSLIELCRNIRSRHIITDRRVLGHSDVAPIRKKDPGEYFDWSALAQAGIGYWPIEGAIDPEFEIPAVIEWQTELKRFGYQLELTGRADYITRAVVLAFQRHWLPRAVSGDFDIDTAWRLRSVGKP